jgi:hypothetical protein
MQPEEIVRRLVDQLAAQVDFDEAEIYPAMEQLGVSPDLADRIYQLTQIAWGRIFLDGLGIQFSPDYLCFNSAGDLVESGQLNQEPYYVAAMNLAAHYAQLPIFSDLAVASADVQAVNNALNNGSNPADLITGPSALFLEPE